MLLLCKYLFFITKEKLFLKKQYFTFFNNLVFDTSDYGDLDSESYFGPQSAKNTSSTIVSTCRYRAFRTGPGPENQYDWNKEWLHVFTARLCFIVIFEVSPVS